MDETDHDDGLAVVLPIRPGIQPGDTTPFGTPASDPTADLGETWGTTPQRRMTADPVSDAQAGSDEPAAVAAPTREPPPGDRETHNRRWPHTRRWWIPRPQTAWLIAVPCIVGLLAGGAIALTTNQGAGHRSTPPPTIAQHAHTTARQLTAEGATVTTKPARSSTLSHRSGTHRLSSRAARPHITPHIRRQNPTSTTTFVSHTLQPTSTAGTHQATSTYQSPVSDREQTPQAPAAAASRTSTPAAGATHTPSVGPTGPNAILGPGHCSC